MSRANGTSTCRRCWCCTRCWELPVLQLKSKREKLFTGKRVVFGQRLSDTVAYEQKYGQHLVPILMEKCVEFLREKGMNEEGVFRLPGQDNLVKQLRNAFDAGERPSFDSDTDVHTVASLFKLYLRELPEPVIPWSQYEDFLSCSQLMNTDEEKARQDILKQLLLLPKANYNLLSFICRFLHEIQLNCQVNKMSVDNLATVIGVNLIRPKHEDPVAIMKGAPLIQKLMTVMIRSQEELFPVSKDLPVSPSISTNSSKMTSVPRSSVGWDAAEDMLPSRDDTQNKNEKTDGLGNSVSPGSSDQAIVKSEPCETVSWKPSPRKRTQTLPSRKCSFTLPPQAMRSADIKDDIFGGDFWASSLEGERKAQLSTSTSGHKRTLSEEFSSILDLHRKSTYDNVPSPLHDSIKKTSNNSQDRSKINCSGTYSSKNFSSMHEPQVQSTGINVEKQGTKQESTQTLQNLIIDLRNEVEAQKQVYEERIGRLEKENYDIWNKVVKLNEDIEMEKSKCSSLEIKLRHSERDREEAEKRNRILEEEIQGFLKSTSDPSKAKLK